MYKVNDLDDGVATLRARGFEVEYGRTKNPYNAVSYFPCGPYLELLGSTTVPPLVAWAVRRLPGRRAKGLAKVTGWDTRGPGLCGLCLEGDDADFHSSVRAVACGGPLLRTHRLDTHGRDLRYQVFFPADWDLPFMMTRLSIDPRPSSPPHPGGVRRIAQVHLPPPEAKHPMVRALCPDEELVLVPPDQPMRTLFDDDSDLDELMGRV